MLQNNPTSQQLLLEAGCRSLAIHDGYMSDLDPTIETNMLDTIYSVYLNDKSDISAFGQTGYEDLIFALKFMRVSCQRRALNLTAPLVKEHKLDYNIVTELVEFPRLMMELVYSTDDAELRKAALRCLIVLAEAQKVVNSGQGSKFDDMLKKFPPGLVDVIITMAPEDLASCSDEIPLVEKLWNAYYDESSPLRKK